MKYQIKKCKGGWFWRIVARNGRIWAHSETYTRKSDAVKAARRVKQQSMYCRMEIVA